MKWRAEVEATPEEVAELIKRVGRNWQQATAEIAQNHHQQLIDIWNKNIQESINNWYVRMR